MVRKLSEYDGPLDMSSRVQPYDVIPSTWNPDPWDEIHLIPIKTKLKDSKTPYRAGVPIRTEDIISIDLSDPVVQRRMDVFNRKPIITRLLGEDLGSRLAAAESRKHYRLLIPANFQDQYFPTKPSLPHEELGMYPGDPDYEYYVDFKWRRQHPTFYYYQAKRNRGHSLHSQNYRRCEGWARGFNRRCKRKCEPGERFCPKHKYKGERRIVTGRYSTYLPKALASRLEELTKDPELLNLSEEIGLNTLRTTELLKLVKDNEAAPKRWQELRTAWTEYRETQTSPNPGPQEEQASRHLLSSVNRLIMAGAQEADIWQEIAVLLEGRRRLVESESRRLEKMQQMVPSDKVLTLVEFIVNRTKAALETHIMNNRALPAGAARDATDRTLESIAADIRLAISGEGGGSALPKAVYQSQRTGGQLGAVAPHPLPTVPPTSV